MTKLWGHQEVGLSKAAKAHEFAFFWEAGTGKTCVMINVLRKIYKEHGLCSTLILAPPIVLENWRDEFYKYSEYGDKCLVLTGSGAKRNKIFREYSKYNPIIITNYEAMLMNDLFGAVKIWHPKIIVMDESHRLKNYKSKRAKRVENLCDHSYYRYQLTGTPVLNSEMDLFQQFRCLDQGRSFGKNFHAFKLRYFEDQNAAWSHRHNHFPKYVPKAGAVEAIKKIIQPKTMYVEKKQCLDLPPLVKQVLRVEMSPEQSRVYNEMRDHFIAFLENSKSESKAVVANMALTKALRLQQIVSGFVKFEDGIEKSFDENPRIDALAELLDELTPKHKVIVWATFKNNYAQIERLCKKLDIGYAQLHGSVSTASKEINIGEFRKNPKVRVMIANQGSAGIGINLVEASYSIYYSRNFSLEQDIQSEARNYRGGSETHDKITRIDLVCQDTIDGIVLDALRQKQNISDRILDIGDQL